MFAHVNAPFDPPDSVWSPKASRMWTFLKRGPGVVTGSSVKSPERAWHKINISIRISMTLLVTISVFLFPFSFSRPGLKLSASSTFSISRNWGCWKNQEFRRLRWICLKHTSEKMKEWIISPARNLHFFFFPSSFTINAKSCSIRTEQYHQIFKLHFLLAIFVDWTVCALQ